MIRLVSVILFCALASHAYPIDGAARTGIRRLAAYKLAHEGKIKKSVNLPPGALWNTDQIKIRLSGSDFDITTSTPEDSYLKAGLQAIFAIRDDSYSLALLDISDPSLPRYAAIRPDVSRIPGSVGKLFVATGIFGALRRIHPSSTAAREKILRDTIVTADSFVYRDGKTVPFFNDGDAAILNRRLESGDKFSLWEWLDHMLSQSSNAAASTTWKQAMLLHKFGAAYPPAPAAEAQFFKEPSKTDLRDLALESLESALTESGLDTSKIRIGTFFTSGGSRAIPGTASYSTPRELLRWLIKMEQGKLVDAWSSLELKRLLYCSRPRYRYASSPALAKAAVYFKSGSLFQCEPEPGYRCVQYKGNKTNLMHSVTVVESGSKAYLVAMTSNVLRLNSAVEHQTIATEIERLIQRRP
ncbi:MAG: serine hydrolase [Acidimicrobiia bacterium]|nr:serine hydrolase [Acidimicrobiia bacterium]